MPGYRRQLKRVNTRGHARYLTCSCYRRLPLLNNPAIRDAFVEQLTRVQSRGGFDLYAWVIMPEHVHLLLLPHDGEVTSTLRRLKAGFAQRVIQRWRTLDAAILNRIQDARGATRFWQPGGGYDRNIDTDHELEEKINYTHANPVRRGLVDHPCDWQWSSARSYEGLNCVGPVISNPWA